MWNKNLWNEGAITQPRLINLSAVEVSFFRVFSTAADEFSGGSEGDLVVQGVYQDPHLWKKLGGGVSQDGTNEK